MRNIRSSRTGTPPHNPTFSWHLSSLVSDVGTTLDQSLELVYKYIELPLQNAFNYFGIKKFCMYRRRYSFEFINNLTQILFQSFAITYILYFILLYFAHVYCIAIERYYFIDPLLSNDRQCINIQFISINNNKDNLKNIRLKENFLRENLIVGNESYRKENYDYTQIHRLFDLLENTHYMICQRSLYLYARFHVYSSLLHSNSSQFRLSMSRYPSSFSIDRPPFVDLCVHTSNHSHFEQLKSHLLPLSSSSYSSVNLFLFNFNFTQVSITLYELNNDSLHLERVSIHTGWLRDMYSKYYFFKYYHGLSTVLFDGKPRGKYFIDYFNYKYIPIPSDPILGLNEMIQQAVLVLPLCQSTRNK